MKHQAEEKLIIDRFEGDYAVCETPSGGHIDIPKNYLPETAKEGDIIYGSRGKYAVSYSETKARRVKINELLKRLIKE